MTLFLLSLECCLSFCVFLRDEFLKYFYHFQSSPEWVQISGQEREEWKLNNSNHQFVSIEFLEHKNSWWWLRSNNDRCDIIRSFISVYCEQKFYLFTTNTECVILRRARRSWYLIWRCVWLSGRYWISLCKFFS